MLALAVVTVGIFYNQVKGTSETAGDQPVTTVTQKEGEALSATDSANVTEEPEQPPKSPTASPTSSPITPESTTTPQQKSKIEDGLVYPNVTIKEESGSTVVLESGDSSETITDWYKDKINSLGMNVKSFVTTRANDKVLNKLVGADEEREIRIEISKEPGESSVMIRVESKQ